MSLVSIKGKMECNVKNLKEKAARVKAAFFHLYAAYRAACYISPIKWGKNVVSTGHTVSNARAATAAMIRPMAGRAICSMVSPLMRAPTNRFTATGGVTWPIARLMVIMIDPQRVSATQTARYR